MNVEFDCISDSPNAVYVSPMPNSLQFNNEPKSRVCNS